MTEIILDGENLTFEEVLAVAYGRPNEPRVRLADAAKANVQRAADAVDILIERGEIAYGITTGFGAFKDKIISRDEVGQLQRNIILSHAVGVGKPFDTATVRAIMLIRANTLARGFSGIRVETLELILEFLNRGVHPVIPEKGSLGASGDLAPLAHFACVLIGEGKAEYNGEVLSGADVLERAGLCSKQLVRSVLPSWLTLPAVLVSKPCTVLHQRSTNVSTLCARIPARSTVPRIFASFLPKASSSADSILRTSRTHIRFDACRRFTEPVAMRLHMRSGC